MSYSARQTGPSGAGAARPARIPTQAATPKSCRHCGATAPGELVRMVGVWSIDSGRSVWDCLSCARANLDSIEARVATW